MTEFSEKSFAVLFLLLMSIPALPIPTGGITHVFEIITILISLELIIGLKSLWFPKFILRRELGPSLQGKALPFILKRIRWFEKFSRPRLGGLIKNRLTRSFLGLVVFGLSLAAFLSVPFSGLDTLPSLGVVFIALGIILEDVVGALIGMIIGGAGVLVSILLGATIIKLLHP